MVTTSAGQIGPYGGVQYQMAPQYAGQMAPQYAGQMVPQYAGQMAPQYAGQMAPAYGQQHANQPQYPVQTNVVYSEKPPAYNAGQN